MLIGFTIGVCLTVLCVTSANASHSCGEQQWLCDNGDCIENENRCDGVIHCFDGSDEIASNCIRLPCPSYAFRCAYGACVAGIRKCDGQQDCADNSDETELLCSKNPLQDEEKLRGKCALHGFQCRSGECLDSDRRCDGVLDCQDGSDETVDVCSHIYCPFYAFRCGYGACVRGKAICDSITDCADNSDEANVVCGRDRFYKINHTAAEEEIKVALDMEYTKTIILPITREKLAFHKNHPENGQKSVLTPLPPPTNMSCIIPLNRQNLIVEDAQTKQMVQLGEHVPSCGVVNFRCAAKWQLVGEQKSVCVGNKWFTEVPTCRKTCSAAAFMHGISTEAVCSLNNVSQSCFKPMSKGGQVQLRCAPGYEDTLSRSEMLLTCSGDGTWSSSRFKCSPLCGLVSEDAIFEVENPWDVSIYQRSYSQIFERLCGGSIVSPKMIITAAVCFSERRSACGDDHTLYNIVEGAATDLQQYTQGEEIGRAVHNISEIIFESLNQQYQTTFSNGIAIAILVNYFKLGPNRAPVCLQFQQEELQPYRIMKLNYQEQLNLLYKGAAISIKRDKQSYLVNIVAEIYKSSGQVKLLNVSYFKALIQEVMKRYEHIQ